MKMEDYKPGAAVLSMADKVELLGFDAEEFKADIFKLDDKIIKNCTIPLNFSNLEEHIYPELRRLKEKYGLDVPIGIVGLDVVRLEKVLDAELMNRGV